MEKSSHKQRPANGQNFNSSNLPSHQSCSSSAHSGKKVLAKHTGSLEIIEGDASGLYSPANGDSDSGSRPPSQAFQRPLSRSSVGSVPPRPDSSLSRRMATPTKQISLQAVKRKEESSELFLPDVDFAALNLDKSYNRAWDLGSYDDNNSSGVSTPKYDSESEQYAPQHATQLRLPRLHESEELGDHRLDMKDDSRAESSEAGSSHSTLEEASYSRHESTENSRTVPSTEHVAGNQIGEDDDEDDEDSDEEERKAPNELLMEFVECLMKKDYKNAEKLCKMILLYEPTNPEALKFQPVIEEKLRLDAETQADGDDGEDDDDDDGEDDEDNDDDDDNDEDDSSSDNDDDESDEDDEEESIFRVMAEAVAANYYANQEPGQDGEPSRRRDSGIASDSEP